MDRTSTGITLRRDSGLPAYRQLVDQLRLLIQTGRYREGDYLPVMREVAAEVGLNLNTVNRAYQQLQRDGLIRSITGKGAVIVGRPTLTDGAVGSDNTLAGSASRDVTAILSAALDRAIAAGLTLDDVRVQVDALIREYAERFPAAPRLAVSCDPGFRSAAIARALAEAMGEAVGVYEPGIDRDLRSLRVIVEPSASGATEVTGEDPVRLVVPVHAHRATIEALMAIPSGAIVAVIAADGSAGRRIADAVSTIVSPQTCRMIVTTDDIEAGDDEIVIAESGHPALSHAEGTRIDFAPAFAMSAVGIIRTHLSRRKE